MPPHPQLLVFDVNETLSDMSVLTRTFEEIGAPMLRDAWFAGVLRDGLGLAAAGASAPFAEIASDSLARLLHGQLPHGEVDGAVERVMDGFRSLPVHPDVAGGIRALAGQGLRLVTLSNGAASVAEGLLERAGVADAFEVMLSVEDAGVWKPARAAYVHALERCRVDAADAMLVAVHPWDTDGAARAGLATAWINRDDRSYPSYLTPATVEAVSLTALAETLAGSTA